MNYEKVYNQLIQKRLQYLLRKSINTELHHIVPRSLGGNNNDVNLVYLTVREHYIAHLLLWKITEYKYGKQSTLHIKMQHAFRMMCIFNLKHCRIIKHNSRLYEKFRLQAYKTTYDDEFRLKCSEAKRGSKNPNYHKYGKDNPNYGSKRTIEQRKHMSEALKEYYRKNGSSCGEKSPSYGRIRLRNLETNKIINVKSEDIQKYLDTNKWIIGGQITTEETKLKISKAKTGKKLSELHKASISKGNIKKFSGENGKKIRMAISNKNKNLVWLTNNKTGLIIRVKKQELNIYIKTGSWEFGRKGFKMSKYIWLHNPNTNERKRILKNNELQILLLLKIGFIYGTGVSKNKHK